MDTNKYIELDIVAQKMIDLSVPGYHAEFSPAEADQAGAFEETALSPDDALESALDPHDLGQHLTGNKG